MTSAEMDVKTELSRKCFIKEWMILYVDIMEINVDYGIIGILEVLHFKFTCCYYYM